MFAHADPSELVEASTEVRIGLAVLLRVVLLWSEMRDPYADWKVRRITREREADKAEYEKLQ